MRSHIGMTIGISVLFLVGVAVLYFVPYGYWIAAVLGVIGINTVPVLMKSNQDEQGDLQKSAMQLSKVATGIEKVTLKVKSGVESFGGDASKQVQETEHLAEVLATSKTQTEKIGTMSENTLDAMSNTLASVSQAVSVIHSLNTSLEDIGKSNQDISSIANQASQALFRAREAVETIQQRTEAIDEIVVQTKLLSFNASIEAARAGQEGKGFAVVAEEVGRLADNSGRIAKEINQIVIQTVESITQSSKEFEKRNADCQEINHKNVTDGIGLAQDAQSAIETIRKEAGTSLECMGEAKELSMQLLQAMDLNTKIADQLNVISHANLDQAKTFEELSKVLGRGVEDLNGLMSDIIGIATGSIVKDIDCAVADKIRDQHTLIDVRRPAEFNDELGHVSKAILLTLDEEFENKIKDYDPNNHYIFICRSGGRSARAARIALSLGFKHISNLEGGMLAWNNKFHLPVERKA